LLHVLLIEEDALLAWDLKEQLEKWGFGLVAITNHTHFSSIETKIFSLAILDRQSIRTLSLLTQLRISIRLFPSPIILLVTYLQKWQPNIFLLLNNSQALQKPFSVLELRQAIERLLNIALVPLSEEKG
jgi:DNA-binding response OmpR family regulator